MKRFVAAAFALLSVACGGSNAANPGTGAGSRITKEFDLRVYTCAELSALMRRHGLEPQRVLGGADESPYSTESRRLVVIAARNGA